MRAKNFINREGQQINFWTIVKYSHTDKQRKPHYLCKCTLLQNGQTHLKNKPTNEKDRL